MSRFSHLSVLRLSWFALSVMLAAYFPVAHADVERTGGPYVPTPQAVVDEMLKFARVVPEDFIIDLGSGDGRIVLTAVRRYSARGLGYDIDPELVKDANEKARKEGLSARAAFEVEDVRTARIERATVLTLYLLPAMNRILQPRLFTELKPGTRIVAHDFDLGDWKADRQVTLELREKYETTGSFTSNVYLWIVPAKVAGNWTVQIDRRPAERIDLALKQQFQSFEGEATLPDGTRTLRQARIEGARVYFQVPSRDGGAGRLFRGRVNGEHIEGEVHIDNEWVKWTGTRRAVP